jgi:hypothetical protein
MLELLQHALSLVYGVVACLAAFAVFYAGGLALLPRKPGGDGPGAIDGLPAVVSASLYAVLCWFGIGNGVALTPLMAGYLACIAALVALRRRHVLAQLQARHMFSRSTQGWALAFALFYGLCYAFLAPSVTGEYLPLKLIANHDLYWYITHTRFLQDLGRDNVDGFSFLGIPYKQTPAVFYLLGMLSALFRLDPLAACMPALFGFASLIALLAARMSRIVFGVSRAWAVAIGAILVCGPFFRYVLGSYYLSTMMALPVFLHLIWLTASDRSDRRLIDPWLWLRFTPHYALLLLLYPVLFFSAAAAQVAVVALNAFAQWQSAPSWRTFAAREGRIAARIVAGMAVSFGLLAGAMRDYLLWTWRMARELSVKNAAGWPVNVISPFALFGVPGPVDQNLLKTPVEEGVSLAGFVVIAAVLLAVYFWRDRATTTRFERTLVGVAAGTLVAYVLYYQRTGYSYQQWKFASYFPWPWTFVTLAATARLMRPWAGLTRLVPMRARRLAAPVAAILFVGGNLVTHELTDPGTVQLNGAIRNLAAIDRLSGFRDVSVDMDQLGPTMMAPYFIRTKTLHMVNPSYYQHTPVALDQISPQRPYFAQDVDCDGVGHDQVMTIEGLGCLIFAPPAVRFDTDYPFSRTYLPITLDGFHPRETGGRWNHAAHVQIEIMADDKDILLTPSAFANLHVSPLAVAGRPGQRMLIGWGRGRVAGALVTGDQWVSLPVGPADWRGSGRQRTLVVSIGLPDAVAPSLVGPRSNDRRPLAVFFGHLSVTAKPRGFVVVASGEATR